MVYFQRFVKYLGWLFYPQEIHGTDMFSFYSYCLGGVGVVLGVKVFWFIFNDLLSI